MSTMNTATKLASGNIRTPKGRMVYPSLFEPSLPKGETDKEKARYQVTLLIPKGANIDVLKAAVKEVLDENVSEAKRKTTKVKTPFLKTEDQERFAEFAEDYPVMIRCNAKFKPEVVSPTAKAVSADDEADEVYSGRFARITVRPFFYDHPTGGKGVSLGLQNVQLLDHADPIAGGRVRAESEFEAVSTGLDDLDDEVAF